MLRFKNVTKKFGKITALEYVSFGVDEGEFVFITGASGAGKTTIMRLILRDLLPDDGEISLGDLNITDLNRKEIPKLRQKIGVVFQDFKVLPEKTLKENVEIALAIIGADPKEWDDRVEDVLKLTGLNKRKNLFPSQLSGGELQRVSLARALVVNPKLILADEPTGNLDWDTADQIMDLLETINKKGKTVIVATHHRKIVDRLKKRVIKLQEGKVVGDTGKKGSVGKSKDKDDDKDSNKDKK
jgi:cell division transport system ATP-binding protein